MLPDPLSPTLPTTILSTILLLPVTTIGTTLLEMAPTETFIKMLHSPIRTIVDLKLVLQNHSFLPMQPTSHMSKGK